MQTATISCEKMVLAAKGAHFRKEGEGMAIRQIMKSIREGQAFIEGPMKITYYDALRDTFLLDSIYGGVETRTKLSARTVRNILKEKA